MITKKEYKAAEKRFSALFDRLYSNGLSANEWQEFRKLQEILISYDQQVIFCDNLRSGNYRTN